MATSHKLQKALLLDRTYSEECIVCGVSLVNDWGEGEDKQRWITKKDLEVKFPHDVIYKDVVYHTCWSGNCTELFKLNPLGYIKG